MLGNNEFCKHVNIKGYTTNMFHFRYVRDIVPIVLSIGHSLYVP